MTTPIKSNLPFSSASTAEVRGAKKVVEMATPGNPPETRQAAIGIIREYGTADIVTVAEELVDCPNCPEIKAGGSYSGRRWGRV